MTRWPVSINAPPSREAGVTFTSAAYALQVAWTRLFVDAGCLDEEGLAEASQWVSDYVTALQTDLATIGLYTGEIDGVYGPETIEAVERLQEEAGLPVTGLFDPATQEALASALGERESAEIAALQGILTTTGHYSGPIDGRWSRELEDALKAFQTELGVPATGVVDAATLPRLRGGPGGRRSTPRYRPVHCAYTHHDPGRADHDGVRGHHDGCSADNRSTDNHGRSANHRPGSSGRDPPGPGRCGAIHPASRRDRRRRADRDAVRPRSVHHVRSNR